jgi:hypothetical protein
MPTIAIGVWSIEYPGLKLNQEIGSCAVNITMFAAARHPSRTIVELMEKADRDLTEVDEINRHDLIPLTGKYFNPVAYKSWPPSFGP